MSTTFNFVQNILFEDLSTTKFDCVILQEKLPTIKNIFNTIEDLIKTNSQITVIIKIIGTTFGVSDRSYIKIFKKKFDLTEYIALPNFYNFKIMLPCKNNKSCKGALSLYNPVKISQKLRNHLIAIFIYTKLIKLLKNNIILISNNSINRNYFSNYLQKVNGNKITSFALHNASAGSGTKAIIAPIDRKGKIFGYLKISNILLSIPGK